MVRLTLLSCCRGDEVCRRGPLPYGRQETGTDRRGALPPETILMKRAMLLATAALTLTAFVPEQADAQGRRFGVHGSVGRGPVVVGRGPVYGYPRGCYGYRRGYYRPGVGAAVGLGILGGAALGAAAAAPYYGYGGDPCLRQSRSLMRGATPSGPMSGCARAGQGSG